MCSSVEIEKWLAANKGKDYMSLLLAAGKDEAKKDAVMQQECRRRVRSKLPFVAECLDFRFPTLLSAEQCTSEVLAQYHAGMIDEGGVVADLTSGLGIDSMYLSRRASKVYSIECNPTVSDALRHNCNALGIDAIEAVCADAEQWIREYNGRLDAIYIDPARRDGEGGRIYNLSDCSPNVVAMMPLLLEKAQRVIIKASPMFDAVKAMSELGSVVSGVQLVGTEKECKELVIICTSDSCGLPTFDAVTLNRNGEAEAFRWTLEDEYDAVSTFGEPEVGGYLLEPYPTVMKGGAFRLLSERFHVAKAAQHTHLYFSTTLPNGFPGHVYRIVEVLDFDKRAVKELGKRYRMANVAVRNFPIQAPELEKKLNVKPGGDLKIFGLTTNIGKKLVVTSQTFEQ